MMQTRSGSEVLFYVQGLLCNGKTSSLYRCFCCWRRLEKMVDAFEQGQCSNAVQEAGMMTYSLVWGLSMQQSGHSVPGKDACGFRKSVTQRIFPATSLILSFKTR